jgi:uncharacterized protein (UPF0332 family)
LKRSEFSDWAVCAAFYAMYHSLLAIALKFGYDSRNQDCTIALIESMMDQGMIKMDQKVIEALKASDAEGMHGQSAIDLRESFQYGVSTKIDDDNLAGLKDLCRTAIEDAKRIVYG